MPVRRSLFFVVVLVLSMFASFAAAQRDRPPELRIRIVGPDERTLPNSVRVKLLLPNGIRVDEQYTDATGSATFRVNAGRYKVEIAETESTAETESPLFFVQPGEASHMEEFRVQRKAGTGVNPGGAIAAEDLNVPSSARTEYEKGIKALSSNNLPDAKSQFEKAVKAYPKYVSAWVNLGNVAVMNNDPENARASYDKALAIAPKSAFANSSMAGLLVAKQDYKGAQPYLETALSSDPSNGSALNLMTQVSLQLGDLDQTIAFAERAHAAGAERYPNVHVYAGNAMLKKNDRAGAAAQYRMYLKEAPDGRFAPKVKDMLAKLEQSASEGSPK